MEGQQAKRREAELRPCVFLPRVLRAAGVVWRVAGLSWEKTPVLCSLLFSGAWPRASHLGFLPLFILKNGGDKQLPRQTVVTLK